MRISDPTNLCLRIVPQISRQFRGSRLYKFEGTKKLTKATIKVGQVFRDADAVEYLDNCWLGWRKNKSDANTTVDHGVN